MPPLIRNTSNSISDTVYSRNAPSDKEYLEFYLWYKENSVEMLSLIRNTLNAIYAPPDKKYLEWYLWYSIE